VGDNGNGNGRLRGPGSLTRTNDPAPKRYIVQVMDHIRLETEIIKPPQSCNQMCIAAAMHITAFRKWNSDIEPINNNSSKS